MKMKKLLTRMIALALVAVFFAAPTAASAATIETVYDYGTSKEFHYAANDMLIINSDETAPLNNNEYNGAFYASEGGSLWVFVQYAMPCDSAIMLYDASTGHLVTEYDMGLAGGVGATFNIAKSGYYRIIIKAQYSTAAIVDFYAVGVN